MSTFWGVQGGASSTLVEAPQAPDIEGCGGDRVFGLEKK